MPLLVERRGDHVAQAIQVRRRFGPAMAPAQPSLRSSYRLRSSFTRGIGTRTPREQPSLPEQPSLRSSLHFGNEPSLREQPSLRSNLHFGSNHGGAAGAAPPPPRRCCSACAGGQARRGKALAVSPARPEAALALERGLGLWRLPAGDCFCHAGRSRGTPCTRQAAQDLLQRDQALQVNQLHQSQLQMQARLLAVVQLIEGAQHYLQETGEILFAEEGGGAHRAGAFIARDLQQLRLSPPSLAIRQLRR